MEAKVFGGANIHQMTAGNHMIGQKNILIAKEILKSYSIPIIAEDTGGNNGRRIMLVSDVHKVLLKYVPNELIGND